MRTYCIAQGTLLNALLCLEWEGHSKGSRQLIHSAGQQTLTQHCKATMHQQKLILKKELLGAMKLSHLIKSWVHDISHLLKSIAFTTQKVSLNGNCGFVLVTIYQYQFTSCNKSTPLVQDGGNRGHLVVGSAHMGTFCLSCFVFL